MGQRTQVILQVVNNKGEKLTRAYHFQWGIGRVMPLQLMDLFNTDYFKKGYGKDYSIFDTLKLKEDATDITDEATINDIDIDDITQISKAFREYNNNNGGMIVQVTERENSLAISKFRVGFILGDEECVNEEPFSRYVTAEEYMDKCGGIFCDENFRAMFNAFLKFAEVEQLGE